jgi:hypothetical protein
LGFYLGDADFFVIFGVMVHIIKRVKVCAFLGKAILTLYKRSNLVFVFRLFVVAAAGHLLYQSKILILIIPSNHTMIFIIEYLIMI